MDFFEFNKIAGAVLGTLVFAMGIGFLSEIIFHKERPEEMGYVINIPEAGAAVAEVEEEVTPLPVLLASADASAGERASRACAACHSFEEGGANKVGPNLWNVVGGPKAHLDNFNYSNVMAERGAAGELWGFEELDGFLAGPRNYMNGTSMAFAGIRDPEDRANMIAYLRSLSASPVPLPAVE